jgi:hypothetical protein
MEIYDVIVTGEYELLPDDRSDLGRDAGELGSLDAPTVLIRCKSDPWEAVTEEIDIAMLAKR